MTSSRTPGRVTPTDPMDDPWIRRAMELMGDPQTVLEEQQQFRRDHVYLELHLDDWRAEHAGKWIVVYNGELRISADSPESLREMAIRERLPLNRSVVGFVDQVRVERMHTHPAG